MIPNMETLGPQLKKLEASAEATNARLALLEAEQVTSDDVEKLLDAKLAKAMKIVEARCKQIEQKLAPPQAPAPAESPAKVK